MSAYLISGPSGSGKSTVGKVLQKRGFRVIETDFEDDLSAWIETESGKQVAEMPSQPYTAQWLAAHKWLWNRTRMNELLSSIGTEPVFFCGGAYNEKEFFGSFHLRFGIYANNQILTPRLQDREPERWANGSTELQNQLAWNDKFRDYCLSTGAIVIDSSVSSDLVSDRILSYVK